jgi:hypothetical protein
MLEVRRNDLTATLKKQILPEHHFKYPSPGIRDSTEVNQAIAGYSFSHPLSLWDLEAFSIVTGVVSKNSPGSHPSPKHTTGRKVGRFVIPIPSSCSPTSSLPPRQWQGAKWLSLRRDREKLHQEQDHSSLMISG